MTSPRSIAVVVSLATLAAGCFSGLRQQSKHDAADSPDSFMVAGMTENDGAATDRAASDVSGLATPPDALPPDPLASDADACQACGDGGASTSGCAPASASAPRYVDPASGTDDAEHGAGTGACAYKTIGFATAHATGEIILAKATYEAPAETFPIVLEGTQRLLCNGATLRGSGGGDKGTVELRGSANGIDQCVIDGQHGGSTCVSVSHGSATGHSITGCDIQRCGITGVYVNAGTLTVSGSTIHDAPLDGILWYGTTGAMTGNQFSGNARDISCGTPISAGITGSGNSAGGGPPVCDMCVSCPF